jgi:dihydrofolate reductase
VPKILNIIATCADNGVMSYEGKRPWAIDEDTTFFHERTAGQTCVLGRVSFEKWPRATFDGRQPLVVTSHMLVSTRHPWALESASNAPVNPPMLLPTFCDALVVAETMPAEIYICGGRRIYDETFALSRPMRLHLTQVHAEIPGDSFFPDWREGGWFEVARRESSDANFRYSFLTLER